MTSHPRAATVGQLKETGYRPCSVKDELRRNVITKLKSGEELFAGIVGFTTHFWTYAVPTTLDSTRQYFSASAFALGIIFAFIVCGAALTRMRHGHRRA